LLITRLLLAMVFVVAGEGGLLVAFIGAIANAMAVGG
jgi:hypothetical protein